MTAVISGIDHLLIAVSDLDRAAAAYRRLGFTLSPRALHSAEMGTANHTIMLERDYFELLAVLVPTERNVRWREALMAGEGVAGLAIATPEAAAARAAWLEAGLLPSEIVDFSRQVDRPRGRKMEARFEIVSLAKGTTPGASIFACAQLTREAVWLPELVVHPNTASSILKLAVSTPELAETAKSWRRALPGSTATAIDGGVQIRIGNHLVDLLEPQAAARRYRLTMPLDRPKAVAIDFAVDNFETCRAILGRNAIQAQFDGDVARISVDHACGVAITMLPAVLPLTADG